MKGDAVPDGQDRRTCPVCLALGQMVLWLFYFDEIVVIATDHTVFLQVVKQKNKTVPEAFYVVEDNLLPVLADSG